MSRKVRIVSFFACLLVIVVVGFSYVSLSKQSLLVDQRTAAVFEEYERERGIVDDVLKRLRTADTAPELRKLASSTSELPGDTLTAVNSVLLGKLFEAQSKERDDLLYSARRLLTVNDKDPFAADYIELARVAHERNSSLVETLPVRAGDCIGNSRIAYLKGIHYVRSLIFVDSKERAKARDLIAQSKQQFEIVVKAPCTLKDQRASVAIELLFKEAEEKKISGLGGGRERLRLFPAGESNPFGRSDGSADREQGRT